MRIETQASVRSTAWDFVPSIFASINQLDMSYDAPRRLAVGKDSLAISSDAASLQKRVMELAIDRALVGPTGALMVMDLFPMHVDRAGFGTATTLQTSVEDREQERLAAMLRSAFETEPFEDGMDLALLVDAQNQETIQPIRSLRMRYDPPKTNASLIGLALSPWMRRIRVSRHRFCVA